MHSPRRWSRLVTGAVLATTAMACGRDRADCARCGTVVIAATGDPSHLLPPLADESVARDIGDQVFERLADLAPGGTPIDDSAYRPALAASWERVDSLTWRFHLRPGARWQDGQPVTSEDVRFSFEAFADSVIDSPARPYLTAVAVVPEDSVTVLVRFPAPSAEQLYDATFQVRSSRATSGPGCQRLLGPPTPVSRTSSGAALIGWRNGSAASSCGCRPTRPLPIRRKSDGPIWRFTADPDAALNLVLSHEADLLETAGGPDRQDRVAPTRRCASCPTRRPPTDSWVSDRGGPTGGPHPIFSDAPTRRALALAVDRETLARSVFGHEAKAPPGPMSQLLWIWSDSIRVLPFDTVQANHALEAAGWRRPDSATTRQRGSRALAFDILVPSTSASRRQLAVALQAMWQAVGAAVTVTAVDFPVFQERLGAGDFDSYIGAWLDEPTPPWAGRPVEPVRLGRPQLRALRQPSLRRTAPASHPHRRQGRGSPALPRGDRHAQRGRSGPLPVRACQLGCDRAAARRGRDRSL